MKLREKLELAELYHEFAQNAIVEALKHYLTNVSGLFSRTGRPPKRFKTSISVIAEEVSENAEKIELELEYINSDIISHLQHGGDEHE